jgi:hypothetical protein
VRCRPKGDCSVTQHRRPGNLNQVFCSVVIIVFVPAALLIFECQFVFLSDRDVIQFRYELTTQRRRGSFNRFDLMEETWRIHGVGSRSNSNNPIYATGPTTNILLSEAEENIRAS